MFFKVVHNKEVHIYNPKDKASLLRLKAYIKNTFKALPQKYNLQYLDEENDEITLATENDYKIMLETSNKIVKIFIKESDEEFFDETVNVVLDDEIESLSLKASTQHKEERQFLDIKEEPKPEVQKPLSQEVKVEQSSSVLNESHISSVSQVTEADIEGKFKKMLPELIYKVKEELMKESMIKRQIEQKSQAYQKYQEKPQKEKVIHRHFICDQCGMNGIEGIRYKCAICNNFDLCQTCEAKTAHDHPFLKIRHPGQAPFKIFAVMRDDSENYNSLEVNGQRVSLLQFPFVSDLYEAFMGPTQQGQSQEGFRFPEFMKRYCPFAKKSENKCEQKPEKPAQKVQEGQTKKSEQRPVKQKVAPKVQQNAENKKVEQKIPEENLKKLMQNAEYVNRILQIDYNRCYKFAAKNPNLSKEELLELYFINPNIL